MLHSENVIVGHYVSLINFREAENTPSVVCLFEIILSGIFLMRKFRKIWYNVTMALQAL